MPIDPVIRRDDGSVELQLPDGSTLTVNRSAFETKCDGPTEAIKLLISEVERLAPNEAPSGETFKLYCWPNGDASEPRRVVLAIIDGIIHEAGWHFEWSLEPRWIPVAVTATAGVAE